MKASLPFNVLGLFVASLLAAAPSPAHAEATGPVDYNRGYCVRAGTRLLPQNAILRIEGRQVIGGPRLEPDHAMFFSPYSPTNLHGLDWGGALELAKTGEVHAHVIVAILESNMHALFFERQRVLCIAENAPREIDENYEESARVDSCAAPGDRDSARRLAEARAHDRAARRCSEIGFEDARPLKTQVFDEVHGSCWAGVDSSARVIVTFRCQ